MTLMPEMLTPGFYRGRQHHTIDGGRRQYPKLLVGHWSAGWSDLEGLVRFLRRRKKQATYNVAIDGPGRAGLLVPFADAAWSQGDGWAPDPDEVLAEGFVAAKDVPRPKRREFNMRCASVVFCNRGFLDAAGERKVLARGGEVFHGRHDNPASRSKKWESYTDEQYATFNRCLPEIKRRCPTLVAMCDHGDVTNGPARKALDPDAKGGSKVDMGPAFDWTRVELQKNGIEVIRFNYERVGWEHRPDLGGAGLECVPDRSYNGPGSVPARVDPGP